MKKVSDKNLIELEDFIFEFRKIYVTLRMILDVLYDENYKKFNDELISLMLDKVDNLEIFANDLNTWFTCALENKEINS